MRAESKCDANCRCVKKEMRGGNQGVEGYEGFEDYTKPKESDPRINEAHIMRCIEEGLTSGQSNQNIIAPSINHAISNKRKKPIQRKGNES